jgi:hypothetical protein
MKTLLIKDLGDGRCARSRKCQANSERTLEAEGDVAAKQGQLGLILDSEQAGGQNATKGWTIKE